MYDPKWRGVLQRFVWPLEHIFHKQQAPSHGTTPRAWPRLWWASTRNRHAILTGHLGSLGSKICLGSCEEGSGPPQTSGCPWLLPETASLSQNHVACRNSHHTTLTNWICPRKLSYWDTGGGKSALVKGWWVLRNWGPIMNNFVIMFHGDLIRFFKNRLINRNRCSLVVTTAGTQKLLPALFREPCDSRDQNQSPYMQSVHSSPLCHPPSSADRWSWLSTQWNWM